MLWTVHLNNLKNTTQRLNEGSVVIGDQIYSFGGYFDYTRLDLLLDVFAFDTNTLRWKHYPLQIEENDLIENSAIMMQRKGHTVVTYQGKAYMWGGSYRWQRCCANKLYRFSPETLSWACLILSGTIPTARERHSACMIGHSMYIFGGFVYDLEESSNDVYCLDLNTLQWRFIETFGIAPSSRQSHSAVVLNDRIYIFGGIFYSRDRDDSCNSEIFYLDVKTRVWYRPVATGTVPDVRRACSMFIYNELIYIFGGFHHENLNDMHMFDPKSNTWKLVTPVGRPPTAHRQPICLIKDDRMFLFGGYSFNPYENHSSVFPHNDIHVLDFKPTLRSFAIAAVVEYQLDTSILPKEIKEDISLMKAPTPPLSGSYGCVQNYQGS